MVLILLHVIGNKNAHIPNWDLQHLASSFLDDLYETGRVRQILQGFKTVWDSVVFHRFLSVTLI